MFAQTFTQIYKISHKMQGNAELLKQWKVLREWGDISAIAELIEKDTSQASRIVNGKQKPTIEEMVKIKGFYEERTKMQKKLKK
jgi:plasmid maintenance system antidote protein VapI